jgi:peptide/nickel transport system substrate-binding protein
MSNALQKLFALLLVLTLGISGCTATAAKTNQIAIGVLGEPSTFNPVLNNVATAYFDYTSESLVDSNGDGKGTIKPALAESWQIDGNTITFTMRPNLKWSDGSPLTVDDVLFSYNEAYLNPKIPNDNQDGLRIGKDKKFPTIQKLDDRRIAFTTPEPFAPALRTLGGLGILPAHKLRSSVNTTEEYTEQEESKDAQGKVKTKEIKKQRPKFMSTWGINTNPADLVSSGMFRLTSYKPGERIIFERNPHYWRKGAQGQQLPKLDRVIWQITESTDNTLMQFRSGNLDVYGVGAEFFSLLKKEEKKGNFTIHNVGPASGTTFLAFNLNKGSRDGKPLIETVKSRWFNNVKFRQAVSYAIDRPRMVNNLFRGLGVPQISPISVGTPFYRADGLETYDFNPEKAKKLLKEAGFKYKGDELFDDQDNQVTFNLITNSGNKNREAMGSQVQQDLKKIGMKVNFNPIAFPLLIDKLDRALDWDAHIISFTGGIEPHDGSNFWLTEGRSHVFNQKPSTDAKPLTGQEFASWEKEINDLYLRGSQELDETKRKEIYYKTQVLTQENLPCIYLINPLSLVAARNTVKNFKPTNFPSNLGSLWNLYEVSIAE